LKRARGGLALALLAFGASASAREYPDLFPTPRGLTMGGALTATATGFDALSYNAAGLALNESSDFMAPELFSAMGSPAIRDIMTTLGSADKSQPVAQQLRAFDGRSASAGVSLLSMRWSKRRFALAFENWTQASLRIRTPSLLFAKVDSRLTSDIGVSAGYAHAFYGGKVRAGFVFRPALIRAGFDRRLESREILDLGSPTVIQTLGGVGWGVDFDLGAQGHLDVWKILGTEIKPSWGIALQNVFESRFPFRMLKDSFGGDPPALERRVNAGVALSAENTGAFKPTLAVDVRNLLIEAEEFTERLAVGLEFLFAPRPFFRTTFRGHLSGGNLGGGIGLGFGPTELELGSYAVNLGRGMGVGVDRRLYGRFALVW